VNLSEITNHQKNVQDHLEYDLIFCFIKQFYL